MKYQIKLSWDDKLILDGFCSAVMAWHNVRHLAENFVNPEKAGFEVPTLVDLANAPQGQQFSSYADDGTGCAAFTLTCVRG
jgi:hypothetical protein